MTTKITLSNIDSTGDYSELVDSAYQTANSAGVYANAAFAAANNSTDTWVRSAANSASSYANSSYIHANAAYTAANNATDTWVRNAANSASSYANSAYEKANTSGLTYTSSNTAPSSPLKGDLWYKVDQNILFQYINDGTSNNWVDITTPVLTAQSPSSSSVDVNTIITYSYLNMGA